MRWMAGVSFQVLEKSLKSSKTDKLHPRISFSSNTDFRHHIIHNCRIQERAGSIWRQTRLIGPLRLPFTWCKTAMLGRKIRTGARPTKGIHSFKWSFPLFVLSQCDFCVPAWRFCTTRMASCKGPIRLVRILEIALNELILQNKILKERTSRSLTSFSIQNFLFGRKARGVLKRRKLTRERKPSALL